MGGGAVAIVPSPPPTTAGRLVYRFATDGDGDDTRAAQIEAVSRAGERLLFTGAKRPAVKGSLLAGRLFTAWAPGGRARRRDSPTRPRAPRAAERDVDITISGTL